MEGALQMQTRAARRADAYVIQYSLTSAVFIRYPDPLMQDTLGLARILVPGDHRPGVVAAVESDIVHRVPTAPSIAAHASFAEPGVVQPPLVTGTKHLSFAHQQRRLRRRCACARVRVFVVPEWGIVLFSTQGDLGPAQSFFGHATKVRLLRGLPATCRRGDGDHCGVVCGRTIEEHPTPRREQYRFEHVPPVGRRGHRVAYNRGVIPPLDRGDRSIVRRLEPREEEVVPSAAPGRAQVNNAGEEGVGTERMV